MEETLGWLATQVALGLELAVVLIVAGAGGEAVIHALRHLMDRSGGALTRRAIWIRFAGWILLALEFALGADIVRTAVAPDWDAIGKLACIAAIRTALSFFLERDIAELGSGDQQREPH